MVFPVTNPTMVTIERRLRCNPTRTAAGQVQVKIYTSVFQSECGCGCEYEKKKKKKTRRGIWAEKAVDRGEISPYRLRVLGLLIYDHFDQKQYC